MIKRIDLEKLKIELFANEIEILGKKLNEIIDVMNTTRELTVEEVIDKEGSIEFVKEKIKEMLVMDNVGEDFKIMGELLSDLEGEQECGYEIDNVGEFEIDTTNYDLKTYDRSWKISDTLYMYFKGE